MTRGTSELLTCTLHMGLASGALDEAIVGAAQDAQLDSLATVQSHLLGMLDQAGVCKAELALCSSEQQWGETAERQLWAHCQPSPSRACTSSCCSWAAILPNGGVM